MYRHSVWGSFRRDMYYVVENVLMGLKKIALVGLRDQRYNPTNTSAKYVHPSIHPSMEFI
jgi:hypothetical protein